MTKEVLAINGIDSRNSAIAYVVSKAANCSEAELLKVQPDFKTAAFQLGLCAQVLLAADRHWPKPAAEPGGEG